MQSLQLMTTQPTPIPRGSGPLLDGPGAIAAPRGAMRARFLREVAGLGLPRGPISARAITEEDLAPLPEAARRYLRFMRVVGRPRGWSIRLGWFGGFRMKPGGPWLRCEAWQYSTRLELARIFKMKIWFAGIVPVIARDTYAHGRGRMLGKALDAITVVDEAGEDIAVGELVTYLNDGILLAPSLLLGPETAWTAVDDGSFDVALTDGGRTVTARVSVDERGAATDFSTTDRFYQPPGAPAHQSVRTRWTTPVEGWEIVDGRPRPTRGRAVWHPPEGPFAYADFRILPGSFAFDVAPGE
jgi:hypothetical protein